MKLTAHEVRRVSVTALVDPKSVRRCYAGGPVRTLTRLRIERAARELGFPVPPRPAIVAPLVATLAIVPDEAQGGDQ
jgi:hypothetical protein